MIASVLPEGAASGRCFCCGGAERDGAACLHCGARWTDGDPLRFTAEVEALLRPGPAALPAPGERDWFMSAYTARIAGTARELWFEPENAVFIPGHEEEAPRGRFVPFGDTTEVALVVLARPDDPALPEFIERNGERFSEIVVVLDAEPAGAKLPRATVVERPLRGDFAAQRNAGMAAVAAPWAFHLDLDETVDDALARSLGPLAAHAEAAELEAVGFPRRNVVDGRLSALYPDVQYRLLPRGGRFENRVHERPLACRDWRRTTIALTGAIDHHLDSRRIAERSRRYDALGQAAEHHAFENLLLRRMKGAG